MKIMDIYNRSPALIQSLMCSLEGYRIVKTRYNKHFYETLTKYSDANKMSFNELTALRDKRLLSFIKLAYETTAYYKEYFNKNKLSPNDIRSVDDLHILPILDKKTVTENIEKLKSNRIPKKDTTIIHTSGTTGSGLIFPTTKSALREQWAVWWRYRIAHGINFNTWCAYFGGRSIVPSAVTTAPFWRVNTPGKQILYSAYHINDENVKDYLNDIERRKLTWLHGYPSIISLLACHIINTGQQPPSYISHITIGAENLSVHQSALIEQAFGVKPIQHYGMAEAVANISENENNDLLVDEDFSYVEFIPINESRSEQFNIVGTNFTNPGFPLLRYNTGDIASGVSKKTTAEGIERRCVKNIDGRSEDYIILSDGSKIGRLDHILKDAIHIKESQFVQHKLGEIELRIVPNDKYSSKDETNLKREIFERLGDRISLKLTYLKEIERTRSGKLRFVVNMMEKENP